MIVDRIKLQCTRVFYTISATFIKVWNSDTLQQGP